MLKFIVEIQKIVRTILITMSLMIMTSGYLFAAEKAEIDNNKQELVSGTPMPEGEMTAGLKEYYEKYAGYYLEFPLKTLTNNHPVYGEEKEIYTIKLYNGLAYKEILNESIVWAVSSKALEDGIYTKLSSKGSKVKLVVKSGRLKDFVILSDINYFLQHENKVSDSCKSAIHYTYYARTKKEYKNNKVEWFNKLQNESINKSYPILFLKDHGGTEMVVNPVGEVISEVEDGIYVKINGAKQEKIVNVKNCIVQH